MSRLVDYLSTKITVQRANQISFFAILLGLVLLLFKSFPPVMVENGAVEWASWTGIGADSRLSKTTETTVDGKTKITTVEQFEPGKTLWDWLSVLIIPASLASLGFWFQKQQQRQIDKQEQLEKDIAETNLREEALQAYLDRVTVLLLDPDFYGSTSENSSTTEITYNVREAALKVIHARTLSILRRLGSDGLRKGSVIRFLIDTELIYEMQLNFEEADLRGADLSSLDLSGINLKGANLCSAILIGTVLTNGKLEYANLENGVLVHAKLDGADLNFANLINANLEWASLDNTSVANAILHGVNLRNADVINIKHATPEQIRDAKHWGITR